MCRRVGCGGWWLGEAFGFDAITLIYIIKNVWRTRIALHKNSLHKNSVHKNTTLITNTTKLITKNTKLITTNNKLITKNTKLIILH